MPHRVLICDDEADIRDALKGLLTDEGFEVAAVAAGANAVAEAPDFDVVMLDIKMPGQDGLETLQQIRRRGVATPVVMISGHGDMKTAIEAIRAGANDFLEKPLSSEHVLNALRRVLDTRRLSKENEELKKRLGLTRLVGQSAAIQKLRADIAKAAPTPATVLIVGPSGTGKELVARALHDASLVRANAFVQVNCAAIPDTLIESELFGHERGSFTGADRKQTGKFVEADGGTIFLDEVGDMSPPTQAKVLRVLQEGEVEPVGSPRVVKVKVRVIAATNRDLPAMIREGKFREDLYYRLNVIPLRTPALGEHPEDVPPLVLHFADHFAKINNYRPKRFTDAALMALAARPWPGNVRELKNAIERLMIMTEGDVVDTRDVEPASPEAVVVPAAAPVIVRGGRVVRAGDGAAEGPSAFSTDGDAERFPDRLDGKETDDAGAGRITEGRFEPGEGESNGRAVWSRLFSIRRLQDFQDEAERLFLVAKLEENGGNVTRTAEAIETPRSNLYKKIERYGLRREKGDPRREESVAADNPRDTG